MTARSVWTLAAGLGLATALGWVLSAVDVPLGWILGAMAGGAIATNAFGPMAHATTIRRIGQLLIGTAAAAVLTPDILMTMLALLPAMIGAAVLSNLAGAALIVPFAHFARVDRTTAALSVLPAGMAEMSSLAQDIGARTEVVVVVHTLRVVLVVVTIPIILQITSTTLPTYDPVPGASYGALVACVALGALVARIAAKRGLLNPWILAPMAVGIGLVASGFPLRPLPTPLLIAAQIGIGFALGTRLLFAKLADAPRATVMALASGLTLIAIMSYGVAPLFAIWTQFDRISLVLGVAPGGLGEMIATSKAVGGATALVAGFQFVRSFMTNMFVPPIIQRFRSR